MFQQNRVINEYGFFNVQEEKNEWRFWRRSCAKNANDKTIITVCGDETCIQIE